VACAAGIEVWAGFSRAGGNAQAGAPARR